MQSGFVEGINSLSALPSVFVSIRALDASKAANTRVIVSAATFDEREFTMHFHTWSDFHILPLSAGAAQPSSGRCFGLGRRLKVHAVLTALKAPAPPPSGRLE